MDVTTFAQFGVTGLLFVMWWYERRDRLEKDKALEKAQSDKDKLYLGLASSVQLSDQLVRVIENNTAAVTELRDEISELRGCRRSGRGCPFDGGKIEGGAA